MLQAVEEAVAVNSLTTTENPRDFFATFDGSWQKRGFKSLNELVTCTNVDSGKVLDVYVLSKYCNKDNYNENCQSNRCV